MRRDVLIQFNLVSGFAVLPVYLDKSLTDEQGGMGSRAIGEMCGNVTIQPLARSTEFNAKIEDLA